MKTIVIGDVHGCLDELVELLKIVDYEAGSDRLIFLGDLIDRGPSPAGVVRLVRSIKAECVLGNHEEKYLRWVKHEAVRMATGKQNPMSVHPQRVEEYKTLAEEDHAWLESRPAFIRFRTARAWIAVHAGLEANRMVELQKPKYICRVQYLNACGEYVSTGTPGEAPEGSVRWQEMWHGPESVVYGHAVWSLEKPRRDYYEPSRLDHFVGCFGIDTGCVFGGHLTAAIWHLDNHYPDFVRVKAKKAYFEDKHRGQEG